MNLTFKSKLVQDNIVAISSYFEDQANGFSSTLIIDGKVVLSCDGSQGIDYNNQDADFKHFDYEGLVLAFSQLDDALEEITGFVDIMGESVIMHSQAWYERALTKQGMFLNMIRVFPCTLKFAHYEEDNAQIFDILKDEAIKVVEYDHLTQFNINGIPVCVWSTQC